MQSVLRRHNKSIDEYRHNIKLLKYHLKKEEKVNETLKYKQYKSHKKSHIAKVTTTQQQHPIYSMLNTVQTLNQKIRDMGMTLGDIFRMADSQYQGQIGKEVFMRTIMRIRGGMDQGAVNQMFYAIDTDFNNGLSQDQYQEFLWAHGGCQNKEASRFQKKAGEKFAAKLKKKGVKMGEFLSRCVDPCPAQEVLSKLKGLDLNINECMILLKLWDPSLKGQVKHELYKKSTQNIKQKDETQIQNQKFQRGVKQLCVIFFDRKLNPIVIFEQAEQDGKPGISQLQLQQGLKSLLPQQTDFQIRKWVNLINLNNDSEITREQFVSAIRSFYSIQQIDKYSTQYTDLHPELKKAINSEEIPASKIINELSIVIEDSGMTKTETFHKIDINGNGLVDKEELIQGLKEMGVSIGLVAKTLTVFDRDASGEITIDQWLNILGEDVVMEDVPLPPPKKKDKKVAKPAKKEQQRPKQQKVDKTSPSKPSKQPLKDQDKNKTLKDGFKKQPKKIIKPVTQDRFAEDDIEDTKTELVNDYPQDEEVNVDPVQKQVALMYGANKNKVLSVFKKVGKNKKGINQNEMSRCLGQLGLKNSADDQIVSSIFQTNIASNGTFQYAAWLDDVALRFQVEVVQPQPEVKPETTPKIRQEPRPDPAVQEVEKPKPPAAADQQHKKRGEDHDMFRGLTNLVIKDQQHTDKGYKFSYYISSAQEQKLLNKKYLPQAQKIKSNQKMFEDKAFPLKLASLTDCNPPSKSNIGDVTLLKWKHYSELFKNPLLFHKGIDPNDIRQGELGDCYFLCSLASLAEYNNLIERLFEYIDIQNGYFLVWLCIDGVWKLIELDGFIPTKPSGKNLVFSRCRDGDQELWVVLLEKAYAKAYGNYEHIIGGQPYEAIKDLTGAPGKSFSHRSKNITEDSLWKTLTDANSKKFMMTCGTDNNQQGDMKLDDHSESVTAEGIVIGHAYSILDVVEYKGERLIQLRNPWGTMEWKGPWSDGSKEWTSQAKKKLNYSDGTDDGIFWMPFNLYMQRYATTAVNFIRPDYFYSSEPKKNITNLVVKFKASQLKHGFVMVTQADHRKKGLPDNTPYNVCHFVGANYKNKKIVTKLSDDKYMYQREGCVEVDSSKVSQDSQFIVLINLERGTDINLCTYSNEKFQYECDDSFEVMLEYIEAIAVMEEGASAKPDDSKSFKSWLTSVGQYAFLAFKNITGREITIMIELQQPSNLTLMGKLKVEMVLAPGQADTVQGKIIQQKQQFSFGPMRFGLK